MIVSPGDDSRVRLKDRTWWATRRKLGWREISTAQVRKLLEAPLLTSSSTLLLCHDGSCFNMIFRGAQICDIYLLNVCLHWSKIFGLEADVKMRMSCWRKLLHLLKKETKNMPPLLFLCLTLSYSLLHSINGSWSDPVMITVILFGSSESGLDLVKINWTWDDPLKYLQSWWRMAVVGSQQTKTVPSLTRCCHSVILRSDRPQGSMSHLFEILSY